MGDLPPNPTGDEEQEWLTQQLESFYAEDPELFQKARVLGGRNALKAALLTAGLRDEADKTEQFTSWRQIQDCVERHGLNETDFGSADLAILYAYNVLKTNPDLAKKISSKI